MSDQAQTASQPEETQTDEGKQEEPQTPKVQYLGRELTAEELLEEARKKDAYITQRDQELADLKRQQLETPPEDLEPQLEEAKRQLEKIGYVDKDQVKKMVDELVTQRDANRTVQESVKTLSGKYDGQNDYPKFDEERVIAHAVEKGFNDLEAAYRDMNHDKIVAVEVDKAISKQKNPSKATPDKSDAPSEEPMDEKALEKKFNEVRTDPMKLAKLLKDMGQANISTE